MEFNGCCCKVQKLLSEKVVLLLSSRIQMTLQTFQNICMKNFNPQIACQIPKPHMCITIFWLAYLWKKSSLKWKYFLIRKLEDHSMQKKNQNTTNPTQATSHTHAKLCISNIESSNSFYNVPSRPRQKSNHKNRKKNHPLPCRKHIDNCGEFLRSFFSCGYCKDTEASLSEKNHF